MVAVKIMEKQKNKTGNKMEDTTMKKIMTSIKTLAALLVAGTAFTACSSDSGDITTEQSVNPAQQTYTMTVNAAKGNNTTTRALSLDGNTLNATWATGENVYVKKGTDWATGSLQPQEAGQNATLTGTLSGVSIDAGDALVLQFPRSGRISYGGQLGTIDDIEANFDYATADVTVASVSGGNITVSGTTNFTNQQAILKFTLKDKSTNATINPTALTITDGTNTVLLTSIPEATYTTNGTGVLYVAFPAAGSAKTITLTANLGYDIYTFKKYSVTFSNGSYYAITVKLEKVVPEAVDLNLPSGLKWANMNVGAGCPEDYGHYFAWGETTQQSSNTYDFSTYKWCNGSEKTLTKYCSNSAYGNNGFTDNKTVLDLEDDAARANWGGDWRMPTKADFDELFANTTEEWTIEYGVHGYKFTSTSNGNSIFLPAAGGRWNGVLNHAGIYGHYWSSSRYESYPRYAWYLDFYGGYAVTYDDGDRVNGLSVRPVR